MIELVAILLVALRAAIVFEQNRFGSIVLLLIVFLILFG